MLAKHGFGLTGRYHGEAGVGVAAAASSDLTWEGCSGAVLTALPQLGDSPAPETSQAPYSKWKLVLQCERPW